MNKGCSSEKGIFPNSLDSLIRTENVDSKDLEILPASSSSEWMSGTLFLEETPVQGCIPQAPRARELTSSGISRGLSDRFIRWVKNSIRRVKVFCGKNQLLEEFKKARSSDGPNSSEKALAEKTSKLLEDLFYVASVNDTKDILTKVCGKLNSATPDELKKMLAFVGDLVRLQSERNVNDEFVVIGGNADKMKEKTYNFLRQVSSALMDRAIELNMPVLARWQYSVLANEKYIKDYGVKESREILLGASTLVIRSLFPSFSAGADWSNDRKDAEQNLVDKFTEIGQKMFDAFQSESGNRGLQNDAQELFKENIGKEAKTLFNNTEKGFLYSKAERDINQEIKAACTQLKIYGLDFASEVQMATNFFREIARIENSATALHGQVAGQFMKQQFHKHFFERKDFISDFALQTAMSIALEPESESRAWLEKSGCLSYIRSFFIEANFSDPSEALSSVVDRYFETSFEAYQGENRNREDGDDYVMAGVKKLCNKLMILKRNIKKEQSEMLQLLLARKAASFRDSSEGKLEKQAFLVFLESQLSEKVAHIEHENPAQNHADDILAALRTGTIETYQYQPSNEDSKDIATL